MKVRDSLSILDNKNNFEEQLSWNRFCPFGNHDGVTLVELLKPWEGNKYILIPIKSKLDAKKIQKTNAPILIAGKC